MSLVSFGGSGRFAWGFGTAYCLGCCWALFAILVVAGIMSLAWMLVLTLVVFAEKVFPHGQRVSATIGVALIVLGVVVAGSIS
jgi:predicted metal-binding membrane protein